MRSNCWNRVVSACACLCKGTRELTYSARTGRLFFWSPSITFYSRSLSFGETTRMMWRPHHDLWAHTWGNAMVYILPPALPCLSSVWVHPCALRCECQCHGSWRQTDALCSLLRTSLTWAKRHARPGQTRVVGWFHSDGDSKKKKFRTFFKHQLTCGYCLFLSYLVYLVFTCSQLMCLIFSILQT